MTDMMNYCPRLGQVNIGPVEWNGIRLAVYVPPPRFDAAYWANPHTPQVPQVYGIESARAMGWRETETVEYKEAS